MVCEFYCRQAKAGRKGTAPIQVAISIDGERKFINLPLKYNPEQFKKERESKKTNPLKEYLASYESSLYSAVMEMQKYKIALTHKNLRDYMKNGGIKSYTIQDLFDEYLSILNNRVGVTLTEGAYKKYINAKDVFFKHIGDKKDNEVDTINNAMILSFYTMLQRDYKPSSVAGIMTKIKTIIIYGKDNKGISINPFNGIKIKKPKQEIVYLTDEELNAIKNKDFHCDRLNKIRDLVVFQSNTGLSYADMAALKPEDIKVENGVYYIKKKRQKTGVEYQAVILPEGVEIGEKYGWELPVVSNQRENAYLKEIQALTGITSSKTLTTHLFRKTYATRMLRSNRVEVVAKMLGHSNTKITLSTYAALETETILQEVKQNMNL